jgi:hypothetical protein
MVELLVVMTLTVFVLAAASRILIAVITQFKQQSKIAEANIESLVGLELMRYDLKTAGLGLPWELEDASYTDYAPGPYNDDSPAAPRAMIINDNPPENTTGSDILVIKSMVVGRNEGSEDENSAAGEWHTFIIDNEGNEQINTWMDSSGVSDENLSSTDVVVVHAVIGNVVLKDNGTGATDWFTTFGDLDDGTEEDDPGFEPVNDEDFRIIYGLVESGTPLWPYHDAGYYISNDDVPSRCISGTGVLTKGVMDITSTSKEPAWEFPLLDCVADMQVIVALDGGLTGTPNGSFQSGTGGDAYSDDFGEGTADQLNSEGIRDRLFEVRVYILAHEGQFDPTYTYPSATVDVGEFGLGHTGTSAFNLSTTIGGKWQNYRWRVYRIAERPTTLRGR